jgi:uncharacterized membrane protein
MNELKEFFTKEDEAMILSAIGKAESTTSGEIRVRVEKIAGDDPMGMARKAFDELGMRKTELRNGVLFVLAIDDRKFVILGDDAINEKVPDDFWDSVRNVVIENFKNNQFAKGLAEGIEMAGKQLATFFPCQKDDVNELSDAISFAD